MGRDYPWYEVVEGESLEQGDIFIRCPVVVPEEPFASSAGPEPMRADVSFYDVVILTQSCDLAEDRVSDVILCPNWDLAEAGRMDPALANRDAHEQIRKGRRARYLLLSDSPETRPALGVRIVDFSRVFGLPKRLLQRFASSSGPRLRLCPPYREHLSQAFARFFMRVGLPQDIRLPASRRT
ncbi:MAG: hypothetical protein HY720_09690 [Planctomycetes bacterium]|nr:hypothetical protein [Planctomycetota bacterium]